jgi:hypothetical protein
VDPLFFWRFKDRIHRGGTRLDDGAELVAVDGLGDDRRPMAD